MYNPFNIITSFRLSFLPPLMIYLAAGVSGLTNIVGFSQTEIKGTVYGDDGSGLPFCNIREKGNSLNVVVRFCYIHRKLSKSEKIHEENRGDN